MNPIFLLLQGLDNLSAMEQMRQILDRLVPDVVEVLQKKGPSDDQVLRAEGFIGKILALPASEILSHAKSDPEVRVLILIVHSVAVLSFRENGLNIWGKTYLTTKAQL